MEGAILSSSSGTGFRTHLKNAANALCARTLPKQRRGDVPTTMTTTARHHTYPRVSPQKRAQIPCWLEPLICAELVKPEEVIIRADMLPIETARDDVYERGPIAREVASVWKRRVGPPSRTATGSLLQSLFNDIDLYPTKTQVFEMLVCARQCGRRKSLTLTFGEFCVFAAELRRYSRQAAQDNNDPESPQQTGLKKFHEKAAKNGSEASSPPYEIFLGGSCNPTTWRSDIAIPMLKELGITYYNPQVADWSSELLEMENRAKAAAQALLFVLDGETRVVAASVEVAHHATSPKNLLLVLRPYVRHQTIGEDTISDQEYLELSRARATLQELVERRGLPVFSDIPMALSCAHAVLRRARTYPRRQLGQSILRLKRAFDLAGGKCPSVPRSCALDALRDVTRAPRELADKHIPANLDNVDFETFCAAVAELVETGDGVKKAVFVEGITSEEKGGVGATITERVRRAFRRLRRRLVSSSDQNSRNGQESSESNITTEPVESTGVNLCNTRLRDYGKKLRLFIPKNNGTRDCSEPSVASAAVPISREGSAGDNVLTPSTERRLEELPAMLGVPVRDVYLGGCFPTTGPRPEDILKKEGFSYAMPRPNDYTRMFSMPTRRPAPAHPESPRTDKKARAALEHDVELRERTDQAQPEDRLSASDFYTVSEDVTPQPFKGTYDEDLILGSKVLLFSMNSESPCFAPMVLAGHYMGLRPSATILLVQPMDPTNAHPYSETAIKDYNRGRRYLTDLAHRSGVPVFDNLEAALACVTTRLRVAT